MIFLNYRKNKYLVLFLKFFGIFVFSFFFFGEFRGFILWIESFGGGIDGWDFVFRNFIKSFEKD